ncbi:MAG: zf-HC2 domain-containing protein [Candidatus Acidiferrales bacterium]
MSEHDQIRELLALAAAGALDASEESRLSAHLRSCPDCASELSSWQEMGAALRRLPTPQAPAVLIARTISAAQARLTEESQRRSERKLIAFVVVFSWVFVALSWPLAQFLAKGWTSLVGLGFEQGWENFAVFTALCWTGGAVAAVALAKRRQQERRVA